jgi:hypothetical protein
MRRANTGAGMLRPGQLVGIMRGHWMGITAVTVAPDGRHVYTGSEDTTVNQWRADTCEASACVLAGIAAGAVLCDPGISMGASPTPLPFHLLGCDAVAIVTRCRSAVPHDGRPYAEHHISRRSL